MEVKALQNRPKLSRWVAGYWDGFQCLSGSRAVTQAGIGPIPISEIVAYMEAIYLRDVDERLKFIKMIQALDTIYVNHINEKAKQKSEAARKQSKLSRRK